MDFSLTEEQKLLKDSIDKFLDKNYSFELRQSMVSDRQAMSSEIWSGLAGLGMLGVTFPEKYGGFNGGGIETMIVMESIGKNLVLEPYLATVILAGGIINLGASEWQKEILLPGIIGGEMLLALAHHEPQSRFSVKSVETSAKAEGNNWVLEGKKSMVLQGSIAEKLIVSARTSESAGEGEGITLFIVECDEEKLGGHEYPLFDGSRAIDVQLNGVKVGPESIIGPIGGAMPLLEQVFDNAIAALCAEAVGVMDCMHEATLEYLKTREQFGVPISRFQALQHRSVDMFIKLEQAKSMAIMASGSLDGDTLSRRRATAAAKDFVGRAGRSIGQETIQLHGGMGMTNELSVGHYFKRLAAIDLIFGNSAHHRREFANLSKQKITPEFAQPKKQWRQI